MKTFLLASLLLAAVPALAQKSAAVPPTGQESGVPFKGANVIIVHCPDSALTAYAKVAQAILQAGYTIDRADKDLLFVNTKTRPIGKMGVMESVQASIKPASSGAEIQLRGVYSSPALAALSPLSAGDSKAECRGMKGSAALACWEEVQRIADFYGSNSLFSYKRER